MHSRKISTNFEDTRCKRTNLRMLKKNTKDGRCKIIYRMTVLKKVLPK